MSTLTDKLTAHYGPPEKWPEKVRLYVQWSERQNTTFLSHAEEHADAALLELLRENERLKVCGNCEHHDWMAFRCDLGHAGSIECLPADDCHWEPSKWAAHPTEPTP
jgi:hypothetical protein